MTYNLHFDNCWFVCDIYHFQKCLRQKLLSCEIRYKTRRWTSTPNLKNVLHKKVIPIFKLNVDFEYMSNWIVILLKTLIHKPVMLPFCFSYVLTKTILRFVLQFVRMLNLWYMIYNRYLTVHNHNFTKQNNDKHHNTDNKLSTRAQPPSCHCDMCERWLCNRYLDTCIQ